MDYCNKDFVCMYLKILTHTSSKIKDIYMCKHPNCDMIPEVGEDLKVSPTYHGKVQSYCWWRREKK